MEKSQILAMISEMLANLTQREKNGFKSAKTGECVYNTQHGNQGAWCALKDLQHRILNQNKEE